MIAFLLRRLVYTLPIMLGVALVCVIFRDGGYNLIEWKQEKQMGRTAGVRWLS